MDQISLPFRIALVAIVVFAAAWMTVLRPHAAGEADAPAAAAAAPGVAGLERAVGKAKGAGRQSDAANAAAQGADPAAPAKPAAPARPVVTPRTATPPATAAPAAKPAPAPAPAVKTVLLFAGRGAEDAVARDVVRSVRRPGVRTIVASLSELGRYRDLVGTVEIVSAPTILVIGRDRRAQRIEGLPDAAQVRAALAAVR